LPSPKIAPNLSELSEKLTNLNAILFTSKNLLRLLEGGLNDAKASADNPGVLYDPEDYEDAILSLEAQIAELKGQIAADERERTELVTFMQENTSK